MKLQPLYRITRISPIALGIALCGCDGTLSDALDPSIDGESFDGSTSDSDPGGADSGDRAGAPDFVDGDDSTFPEFPSEGKANNLDRERLFECVPEAKGGSVARLVRLSAQEYQRAYFDSNRGRRALGGRSAFRVTDGEAPFKTYASLGVIDEPTFQSLQPIAASYAEWRMREHRGPEGWQAIPGEVRSFLRSEMGRSFRRDIEPQEEVPLLELYERAREELGDEGAVLVAIEAIHLSPETLFRVELGTGLEDEFGRRALGAAELAEALGFMLSTDISRAVTTAGKDGSILDGPTYLELLDNELGELGSNPRVEQFFEEWLDYPNAAGLFKDPSHISMATERWEADGIEGEKDGHRVLPETQEWVASVFTEDRDVLRTLLIGRVGTDTARAGILTEKAWLFAKSHAEDNDPIKRGEFITEELLCNEIPELPVGIVDTVSDDRDQTLRARLAQHNSDAGCYACHQFLDGIGMAFEQFDDFGVYRTSEAGEPVDTRAELLGSDVDGDVSGPVELSQRLAESDQVRQCMVRQAFRFYMGRNENYADACTLSAMDEAYQNTGGSFRALIRALATSDSFRYRYPDAETAGLD
ncbi:MAG: DUF1588 domain-containing protein [Myxococcota bacterium]